MDTPAGQLVMVRDPDSEAAQAYRNLRALLLHLAARQSAKTLLVTSVSGEPATATAAIKNDRTNLVRIASFGKSPAEYRGKLGRVDTANPRRRGRAARKAPQL